MAIFTSLNAVSAVATGQVLDLQGVTRDYSVQAFAASGTPSFNVRLMGSLDGTHWAEVVPNDIVGSSGGFAPNQTRVTGSSIYYHVDLPLVRYLRADVTYYDGSGTVSATISAKDVS